MNREALEAAAGVVTRTFGAARPSCALILGSGWGAVTSAFEEKGVLLYRDIPGLGATRVDGHRGRLVLAGAGDREILIFEGRRHWYESASWEPVAIPVFAARRLGATCLLLTNAAGGIRDGLEPGDLVVIKDHINAMGANPLAGAHDPFWGPRFPDQSAVYDRELRALAHEAAERARCTVTGGVYVATAGPAYETPAEIRAFRAAGADLVGMSTVPEAMLGNAAGMRVAAISCVANLAAGLSPTRLSHDEIVRVSGDAQKRMSALLRELVSLLPCRNGSARAG